MAAPPPEKRFLQGLIQLAAGCVHLGRGRRAPAERLFLLAEEKLESSRPPGNVEWSTRDIERLVASIRFAREALGAGRDLGPLAGYFPLVDRSSG